MRQFLTLNIVRELLGKRVLLYNEGQYWEARFIEVAPGGDAVLVEQPLATGPYKKQWRNFGPTGSCNISYTGVSEWEFVEELPE